MGKRQPTRCGEGWVLHLVVVGGGEADVAQVAGAPRGGGVGELEEGGTGETVLLALVGGGGKRSKRRGRVQGEEEGTCSGSNRMSAFNLILEEQR